MLAGPNTCVAISTNELIFMLLSLCVEANKKSAAPRVGTGALISTSGLRLKDLDGLEHLHCHHARSKRSAFMTLFHAATKSFTNFSFESAHA